VSHWSVVTKQQNISLLHKKGQGMKSFVATYFSMVLVIILGICGVQFLINIASKDLTSSAVTLIHYTSFTCSITNFVL